MTCLPSLIVFDGVAVHPQVLSTCPATWQQTNPSRSGGSSVLRVQACHLDLLEG